MANKVLYHISHISSEYADWLRSADFYKEEISILTNRLAEVSQKYTREDVKSEIEHFQNQFLIQVNNLEQLSHDVREHEKHMSDDAEKLAQHLSNHTLAEHDAMRDRFQTLERVILDLRHEFNKFLSRYM